MSPRHPFALLCAAAERASCRESDVYVSMLPCVHSHVAARGLDLHKLHIVPNGVSAADWDAPRQPLRDDLAQLVSATRSAGESIVGYAGAMGLPNALDSLLDAAARLRNAPIRFLIVGDGHERARLVQRLAAEGLSRVHWFPPVPKAMMPTLLQALDVAFIGLQRQPLFRHGIAPNKLMDYMMSARPVLMAIEAGNDPVAEAGCGLTVAPESAEAIAAGVQSLLAMPPADRERMGQSGREYVLAHHEWAVLAARFMAALQDARGARA